MIPFGQTGELARRPARALLKTRAGRGERLVDPEL